MDYFCPKNTFFQLKHYIQNVYLIFLSFLKPNGIFQDTTPLYCLAQTSHAFYKSIPSKCKFSDFSLLGLKFTKFFMSFFKQKVSFFSKFGSFLKVMRDNSSVLFPLKLYMLLAKVAHKSASFQTRHC